MLEIEVTERGLVPHFRVTRDRKPVRLLVFMIQVGSEEPLWVLAPVGMVATMTTGITDEEHEATSQELQDLEKSADTELGHLTSEVLDVVYGSAPQGLHQAVPEGYPAPALRPGQRYLVFAAEPFATGSAEFTA